uniref:Uncharacterized protein n=1 Tax=Macaca fascicularis TaxID=9541 RepID=Q8HXK1_MACFA|nr:hypothetical protein [Macaca fascicularis]
MTKDQETSLWADFSRCGLQAGGLCTPSGSQPPDSKCRQLERGFPLQQLPSTNQIARSSSAACQKCINLKPYLRPTE